MPQPIKNPKINTKIIAEKLIEGRLNILCQIVKKKKLKYPIGKIANENHPIIAPT